MNMDPKEHLRLEIPEVRTHAENIASCLEYVAAEAEQIGLSFSAHLIRTGAMSVKEAVALAASINGEMNAESRPCAARGGGVRTQ